jgi:hypothetical protein
MDQKVTIPILEGVYCDWFWRSWWSGKLKLNSCENDSLVRFVLNGNRQPAQPIVLQIKPLIAENTPALSPNRANTQRFIALNGKSSESPLPLKWADGVHRSWKEEDPAYRADYSRCDEDQPTIFRR